MIKEKNLKNSPIGVVHYWWSLALFARHFEMEINAPPARIAQHLRKVRQPIKGVLMPTGRTVEVREVKPERIYTFDLRIKHRSRGVNYTSVKAAGRIVYSEGYETSIIRGDVRLGWVYFAAHLLSLVGIMIGLMFSMTAATGSEFFILMVVVSVLVVAAALWRIYTDYIELQAMLMNQIEQAYYDQPLHQQQQPASPADESALNSETARTGRMGSL